ncbi:MAG: HIT domain-containing protein [Candidatus Verstraetearchaeota archaeon]|nr:HIT domain-containing protein [Candidatus Verstraetearchaeota archaeon]
MEKILWAPWRVEFVTGGEGNKEGCIFCLSASEQEDEKNLIFERRSKVFGMLNKFPYNTGHIMIAPYRHITSIEGFEKEEWDDLTGLLKDAVAVLREQMRPDGFNIGFNIGKAAGAGFDHIHLHIVPRWSGDTNFMPVLSSVKVMPEHLSRTLERIRKGFRERGRESA